MLACLAWRLGRKKRRLEFEKERLSKEQVWEMRRRFFCGAQSVSYSNSEPLMVVQGDGHFLVDENGVRYLDSRNNVGHCGWQHPDVVGAIQRQIEMTNSNTRYLHQVPVLLAQKLLGTMPPQLCKVFFVNSGSEANDLALRLAQAHTKSKDCLVVERAYHGHTCSVIDVSPYKFNGKGGGGKPSHVHVLDCPDAYRSMDPDESLDAFGKRCAQQAQAFVRSLDRKIGAFFIESGMSVAGVILPPPNYLKELYRFIRNQGGVCVADEVQVGFGRLGDHFWGFQQQGVVPDIVTMGKPFGNGFPLAAVVCTEQVAASFENGMEYFNTFGGSPLACCAGLAVLEVIERENLQERARLTGDYFVKKLNQMMENQGVVHIGDVRGSGLFLGIEFVRDRVTKEPAKAEVSVIVTKLLRQHRILTSIDGKADNVIVIKPPMTFSERDVDTFCDALTQVMGELESIDFSDSDYLKHTPT